MRSAGATRWVWGKRCLKFEDLNKGPRRLLAGHEQDLAKASVSSSIGSSLFCILPARSPKNAPGPGFKRLRRDHQSISEFVTSRPATTISRRRLSMVAVASRVRGHGASSGRPVLCEVACLRCHDSALRRELDIVGKPPLIRNIVALGRRRSIGRGAARRYLLV